MNYPNFFADRYSAESLIYRLLVEEASRHWLSYTINFALVGVVAGCTAFSAYLIGHMVNETYLTKSFVAIAGLSLLAIALFAVKGLATYAQVVLLTQRGNEMYARLQQRLVAKLLTENLAYFADKPSATIMTQVTTAASAPPEVLDALINTAGRDTLSLIGLTVVMIVQDPMLSIFGLVLMPVAILSIRKLVHRMRISTLEQMHGTAKMMGIMQECLQGLLTVKAFGLERQIEQRVAINAQAARKAADKIAQLSNRSGPFMESMAGFAIAAIFMYGGYRVIVMGASPGEFVSFITAFLLAYQPGKRLARLHMDLSLRLAGVRLLYEMLDSPPHEPDEPDKPDLEVLGGKIDFFNVEFSYRAGQGVIRRMSFVARPGRLTAMVGASGGGKTTAFNLLLRLYEVDKGQILIDDQDISSVTRSSIRRKIAYVGQDVFLFDASIRDNIACGNLSAGDDEIIKAAKAAHAYEFITTFPNGFNTPVGEHGHQLSTGQRQRISIARALLKNAPIILLDEPTSALDSESERLIQSAISELCANRTTLMIAHRLNLVEHADCIYVVENGAIVESGRHGELLCRGGPYSSFYRHILKEEAPVDEKLSALL